MSTRAVRARQQREAAALAALALTRDQVSVGLFLMDLNDGDVRVLAARLAGWFGSELSARLQRERCLTRDEADEAAIVYLQRVADMVNVRVEEAQA
jgi:hypothetical protein